MTSAEKSGSDDDPLGKLTDYLDRLGVHLPGWAITIVVALLALGVVASLLKPVKPVVLRLWTMAKWVVRRRVAAESRRQRRRRMFAAHVDNELRRLELQ